MQTVQCNTYDAAQTWTVVNSGLVNVGLSSQLNRYVCLDACANDAYGAPCVIRPDVRTGASNIFATDCTENRPYQKYTLEFGGFIKATVDRSFCLETCMV